MLVSTRSSRRGARPWIAAALLLALALAVTVVAARQPLGRRMLTRVAARWTEIHTPRAGRERILDPRIVAIADKLIEQGIRSYSFTPVLGNSVGLAPYIVEAAWPVECLEKDTNVVGFVTDFQARRECTIVVTSTGGLALGHCPL